MKKLFKKISFWFELKWQWFRRLFWSKQKREAFDEVYRALEKYIGLTYGAGTIADITKCLEEKIQQCRDNGFLVPLDGDVKCLCEKCIRVDGVGWFCILCGSPVDEKFLMPELPRVRL